MAQIKRAEACSWE